MQAFIDIRFAGTARMEDIWKAAEGVPSVIAAYAVAGDLDAVLHVRVRDICTCRSFSRGCVASRR